MKLNIGPIIRDRRRALDMTQEQLAERLGVTCQSVSRWENSTTYPDIEFLPALADLFGITLDELMGHTQSAKEQRLSRLWDEGEAMEDPEARFEHLARMKTEFPDQWSVVKEMLNLIARHGIRREELRALTMEVLENCPNESYRWDATKIFLHNAEEEEITSDFLNRYTQRFDRNSLLETRYLNRKDWPRYEEMRQRNLLYQLLTLLNERLGRTTPASAPESLRIQMTSMQILHLLTGYYAEPSDGLAGIVDTQPDLWFAVKYWTGLRLSCALTALGRIEEALDVLENTVTAMETFFSLPIGTVLSYRTPTLDRMDAEIVSYTMKGPWCCVELQATDECSALTAADLALIRQTTEGVLYYCTAEKSRNRIWYVDVCLLKAPKGWEWFDTIRNHPRYLACVERMECISQLLAAAADE